MQMEKIVISFMIDGECNFDQCNSIHLSLSAVETSLFTMNNK